jgi:serine/threonine protein phosphatase PrpC
MEERSLSLQWRCIGKSVRGASHLRSELPNQDAIKLCSESSIGLPVMVAVSDGHGSAKSFRSDRGSQFAVETATKVIQAFFLDNQSDRVNFSALKDVAVSLLPQRIVNEWRKAVDLDLQEQPFTDEEKQILVQKESESSLQSVTKNPYLAYGATLLGVLVTEFFIVYIQLGDGDILQVDASGHTTQPLKRDPNLIANETTSLCMERAWHELQVHLEFYPQGALKQMPVLILVATDGYSNSFANDEDFFNIGRDYLEMIRSKGSQYLEEQLVEILAETSAKGSGDDITLGMIKRIESSDRDQLEGRLTTIEKKMEEEDESKKKILKIENLTAE